MILPRALSIQALSYGLPERLRLAVQPWGSRNSRVSRLAYCPPRSECTSRPWPGRRWVWAICNALTASSLRRWSAFAQPTWRESLRDLETCLAAFGPKLDHSGIRPPTARSTLADANEKRDGRLVADFAPSLLQQAPVLDADDPFGVERPAAAYALDSTPIDRCRSLFPRAKFRRRKAASKLHTLLTLHGN